MCPGSEERSVVSLPVSFAYVPRRSESTDRGGLPWLQTFLDFLEPGCTDLESVLGNPRARR